MNQTGALWVDPRHGDETDPIRIIPRRAIIGTAHMSDGATASDSPFIKGRNARLYGKQRESCPYAEGSEDRAAWMQAFEEASDDQSATEAGTVDPQSTVKS
jgi:ribosome modulation factor